MLNPIKTSNEKQLQRLQKRHIANWEQLIRMEPNRYLDATHPIFGYIIKTNRDKTSSNGRRYQEYILEEKDTKTHIRIMDFSYRIFPTHAKNKPLLYMVVGEVSCHPVFGYSMMSPSIFTAFIRDFQRLLPIYPKMKNISEIYFQGLIDDSICYPFHDTLPEDIRIRNHLPSITEMGRMLHYPENQKDIATAKRRLLFDDLLYLAIGVQLKAVPRENRKPLHISSDTKMKQLEQSLPFALTTGQKKTVEDIKSLLMQGKRINALIQGDVACGKSITAFLLMVLAIENGYQAVIMAPTVVLAKQHYDGLVSYLKDMDIAVGFVYSGMKKKERETVLKGIADGSIQCVVGTHGIIEPDVTFANIGMVIVDEEQRFGVETREALNNKSVHDIAYLSMSATPIPRTMAESIYGDHMQVFSIKGMPAGRKSVKTFLYEGDAVPDIVVDQLKEGRQIYVICPAIEDSPTDKRNCKNIKETQQFYKHFFRNQQDVCIDVLNGRQNAKTMQRKLDDFNAGKIHILISTTVVEVGVNNPNATVIIIQNAELFGLSTLHQLRGRVKRGSYQPYCILQTQKTDNERLQAMLSSEDGFELAEIDLKNRKSGNILGLKQSGRNKLIEEAELHMPAYQQVKKIAAELVEQKRYKEFYTFMSELYADEEKK